MYHVSIIVFVFCKIVLMIAAWFGKTAIFLLCVMTL